MVAENLITTNEAALILGVIPGRVRQLVASGELPAQKVGRDNLLKRSDVVALKRVREKKGSRAA